MAGRLKIYNQSTGLWEYVAYGVPGDTGPQGPQGDTGETGEGVPTGGTTGQTLTKNSNTDFDAGWSDAGVGDMTKAVYDPQTIEADAFDQDNMTDGTTNKNYTGTEKTKLSGIATGANVGVVPNGSITGATKTKVTYDSKGLVTAGADATTADIADSTNKRYVTDANLTTIGNQSGTNTGDQTSVTGNAGTATALQTSRNIDGQGFDGTANITVIAPGTHAASSKATPVDADELPLVDSAASNVLKKLTWANLKATLKTYFDSIYQAALGFTAENVANKDTDGTLAANSDTKYASQKATKTYADTKYANNTPLNSITAPTGDVSINSHKLTSVTDPSSAQDAATKNYVDSVAQGLAVKGSVILATAAALPTNTYLTGVITITATGVLTVDGTAVSLNDRILVKDEASQLKNGVYVCTTAGAVGVAAVLTRSTDMDASAEFPGAFVFVEAGTVNTAAGFVCTNSSNPTVGTTAITFTQFSGAGEITAGTGLGKSANTLSIDTTVTVDKTTAQTLTNKTLTSPKVNENVAVASTATEINQLHGVTLSGNNTGDQTISDATISTTDITTNNASTTKHGFAPKATAPSANQLNVVGIANGETVYADKTILDGTTPSTQAFSDAASAGTSLVAAHVDHKHAMPATPTSVSGNAGTATALATPRAINGVNFDGSAAITVPNLFVTLTSADSVGTGVIVGITYGESITLGAPLYMKSDGKVYNADSDGSSTYPVMGLALATASSGVNNVLLMGIYQFAAAHTDFTVGGMVYLSTTAGTFTQTQPSATDNVIQVCGVALAADTLYFNPTLTYITHV